MKAKQVVAALIVKEGKILIFQRTKQQAHPLKWEFPGGKIEPFEEPVAALSRELEEELGIRASIGRKIATIQHNYDANNAVELHFYLVERYTGELQNRIFRETRWAGHKELPTFDFLEADVAMVNDIANGRLELPVSR